MARYRLADGRIANLPDGLSDEEATNIIASNFPSLAAQTGVYPDIDREFNFETEIKDADLRSSLAAANAEEYAAILNNKYGKGNWGLTEYGKAYVTADGRRKAGEEVEDNRKVLIDSALAPFSYHDILDVQPDIEKAVASAAAVIAAPMTGGSSLSLIGGLFGRSILARAAQAGLGDVAANLFIEGRQTLRGEQMESLGDVLTDAGLEGLIVAGGSAILDAPFSVAGRTISRIREAKAGLPEETLVGTKITGSDYVRAKDFATNMGISPEDVPMFTIHTLMQESGTPLGSLASRLEATARQFGGQTNIDPTLNFLNKMMNAQAQMRSRGIVSPDEVMDYYKGIMSSADRQISKNVSKLFSNYNLSSLGKSDLVATNVHKMSDQIVSSVKKNYETFQRQMASPEFYGAEILKTADAVKLNSEQLVGLLNNLVKNTRFRGDKIMELLGGAESRLGTRLMSRVAVDPTTGLFKKLSRKGGPTGEDITVGVLRSRDQDIRKMAFMNKETNPKQTVENLDLSLALMKELAKVKGVGKGFLDHLKKTNQVYSEMVRIFRGRRGADRGLINMFENAKIDTPEKMITRLLNGSTGQDIDQILAKMDRGLSIPGAPKDSLLTREMIIAKVGHTFIRDLQKDVAAGFSRSTAEGQAAAKNALRSLNKIEDLVRKSGSKRTGREIQKVFGLKSIQQFKTLLRDAQEGQLSKVYGAQNSLMQAFNFQSSAAILKEVSDTVNNLGNTSTLKNAVDRIQMMKQADPDGARFYQDLSYAQSVDELVEAFAKASPEEQLSAVSRWTGNWVRGLQTPEGEAALREIFGENFGALNSIALVVRGATEFGQAGSLFTAQLPFAFLHALIKRDPKGMARPLSMMYALKGIGPETAGWKKISRDLENRVRAGMSTEEAIESTMSSNQKMVSGVMEKARKSAEAALAGRIGLFAAGVSNAMDDMHESLPSYEDLPKVPAQPEAQPVVEQPVQQSTVPTDTGLAAIQQIASMLQPIQGVGTSGLEEGAAIARSAA